MINELEVGKAYACTLALLECTKQKTKAGKDFLRLVFTDGQEQVVGNYWDWAGGDRLPPVNNVYIVTCNVSEWNGTKQLNVSKMELNKTTDLNSFRPRVGPAEFVEEYYNRALSLIDDINNEVLKLICHEVYTSLKDAWLTLPAAKGVHHAYVAGNLIHSVNVATLAGNMATVLHADVDLCIAGGLLHDVGKLLTYTWDGIRIDMTPYGQLTDHIILGNNLLSSVCQSVGAPSGIEMLLTHVVLSHHGKKEWGSPVEPKCIEALIVHNADALDANIECIRAASKPGEAWTGKIFTLNNTSFMTEDLVSALLDLRLEEVTWQDDVAECMKQEPSII